MTGEVETSKFWCAKEQVFVAFGRVLGRCENKGRDLFSIFINDVKKIYSDF